MVSERIHRSKLPLVGLFVILAATQVHLQKCGGKADVMIVLDSSTSVGDDNWELQQAFVKNLVAPLTIGPQKDRVAFVTYNTDAVLQFGFSAHSNAKAINDAVDATSFTEGITATGDALAKAKEELQNARKGIPTILFLVTDGKTNFGVDPIEEAKKIKDMGVTLITIGITDEIDEAALKKMSSKGTYNQVSEFSQLSSLIQSLQKKTCETKKKCKPDSKSEVVIVLDSSTSVGDDNWELQKGFVANLLAPLNIGPSGDRVGLVTYNTDAKVVFGLNKFQTLAGVTAAVKKTTYSEGITATGDALKLARTDVLNAARKGVPKIVFLVTDGKTNFGEDPIQEADTLKNAGVKIITVGITEDVDKEVLKKISSDDQVFYVDNFSKLSSLIESLGEKTCASVA